MCEVIISCFEHVGHQNQYRYHRPWTMRLYGDNSSQHRPTISEPCIYVCMYIYIYIYIYVCVYLYYVCVL